MQLIDGRPVFAATDLVAYLACEHLTQLERAALAGLVVLGSRRLEHFDAALRRFKRACEKAGVLTELRRREFYEKPTQERKRKKAAAVKRHMKRNSRTPTTRRRRLY